MQNSHSPEEQQLAWPVRRSNGEVALSALDSLAIQNKPSESLHTPALHALAIQVLHNLRHQHEWTDLAVHSYSNTPRGALLPRPLVSGLPPRRVYIHPDEQIEHIKRGLKEEELAPQREWVLPARLTEHSWTLDLLASVFNSVEVVPPQPDVADIVLSRSENDGVTKSDLGELDRTDVDEDLERRWRTMKRLLLATVDNDSTVVYYVVHDGIVKPRQN